MDSDRKQSRANKLERDRNRDKKKNHDDDDEKTDDKPRNKYRKAA